MRHRANRFQQHFLQHTGDRREQCSHRLYRGFWSDSHADRIVSAWEWRGSSHVFGRRRVFGIRCADWYAEGDLQYRRRFDHQQFLYVVDYGEEWRIFHSAITDGWTLIVWYLDDGCCRDFSNSQLIATRTVSFTNTSSLVAGFG